MCIHCDDRALSVLESQVHNGQDDRQDANECPCKRRRLSPADSAHNAASLHSRIVLDSMQIFVKGLDGVTVTIECMYPHYTTQHLKEAVSFKTNVPADSMRLIFAGRQLDAGTLESQNIVRESTLHLVLSLKGC